MADDLGDAHHRHVFRADDAFESSGLHARTAHSDEAGFAAGVREAPLQGRNQQRSVMLAARPRRLR